MTKYEIVEYIKRENDSFSFDEFFTDDDADLDKRAVVLITKNQIINVSTPLKEDGKTRVNHELIYKNITRTLYNIGFNENGNLIDYHDLDKKEKEYIHYLIHHENILIIMCNEGVKHSKLIWIHTPKTITKKQLDLLEKLETEQEELLTRVSQDMKNKDSLVGYIDLNHKIIKGDNFNFVIDYIKNNNMVNDNDYKLDEDYIFDNSYRNRNIQKR